jgi:hypothetical protein
MSEREAAGKLTSIPGIVDAEATKPIQKPSGVLRLVANGFKTGFLDNVELRIANIPIMQRVRNMLPLASFTLETVIKKPVLCLLSIKLIKISGDEKSNPSFSLAPSLLGILLVLFCSFSPINLCASR